MEYIIFQFITEGTSSFVTEAIPDEAELGRQFKRRWISPKPTRRDKYVELNRRQRNDEKCPRERVFKISHFCRQNYILIPREKLPQVDKKEKRKIREKRTWVEWNLERNKRNLYTCNTTQNFYLPIHGKSMNRRDKVLLFRLRTGQNHPWPHSRPYKPAFCEDQLLTTIAHHSRSRDPRGKSRDLRVIELSTYWNFRVKEVWQAKIRRAEASYKCTMIFALSFLLEHVLFDTRKYES